jgi:CRP-like cAMP-binding protein
MALLESTPVTAIGGTAVPASDLVRVFEHDPDLVQDLDEPMAEHLRRRAVAPIIRIEPGCWRPAGALQRSAPPGWLGLLIIDGLLTKSLRLRARDCPELLGAGDLLRPWPTGATPEATHWKALVPTSVAVLDDRFAVVTGRWPAVFARLLERTHARNQRLVFHMALAGVRRAEARLLMLLAHLAERWGRVTPAGIVLGLPLTHELLAHLASMRRPTATAALHRLMADGSIVRRGDGCWVLPHEYVADPETLAA